MSTRAYKAIRSSFLDGRYFPNERLIETELVTQLNVNRAAVREGLARLEQEGLVVRRPGRGAIVRAFTPQESHDILEMRVQMETLTVRWACERKTPQQSLQLEQILENMVRSSESDDVKGFAKSQASMHSLVLTMASANLLTSLVKTLSAHSALIRHRSLSTPGRLPQSSEEHLRIGEALLRGDCEGAAESMRRHLKNVQLSTSQW